jgi:hypothetical protein
MSDYYIDPATGSDSNDGLSPETAWASLTNVNNRVFKAGDRVRFKAATNLNAVLRIYNLDGTSQPISYEVYGGSKAPRFTGIKVSACKAIALSGLMSDGSDGILISNVQGATLTDLEAQRAYGNGLEIKLSSGVTVTGGRFHDNGHIKSGGAKIGHGILVGGGTGAGPVTITRARCYSNMEDGIQIAAQAVDGCVVEGCLMYDNKEDGVDVKIGSHRFTGNALWGNAQRAMGLHLNCKVTELSGNTMHCYRYALTVADGASVRSTKNGFVSLIKSGVLLAPTAASSAFSGDVFATADPKMKAIDNQSTQPQVVDKTTTLGSYNWVKSPTDAEGVDVDNPSGEGESDDDEEEEQEQEEMTP